MVEPTASYEVVGCVHVCQMMLRTGMARSLSKNGRITSLRRSVGVLCDDDDDDDDDGRLSFSVSLGLCLCEINDDAAL